MLEYPPRYRLAPYVLLSVSLHLPCFIELLPLHDSAQRQALTANALSVEIVEMAKYAGFGLSKLPPAKNRETRPGNDESGKKSLTSPPGAPKEDDETPPILVSVIAPYLDTPITEGFMILSIEVDDDGSVESTETIYSQFPRHITQTLEKRFAAGTYQAARKKGRPIKGSLLVKIDASGLDGQSK